MENTSYWGPYKSNEEFNREATRPVPLPPPRRVRIRTVASQPVNSMFSPIPSQTPASWETGTPSDTWRSSTGEGVSSVTALPFGYHEFIRPVPSQLYESLRPGGSLYCYGGPSASSGPIKSPPWQPGPKSSRPSVPWAPSYLNQNIDEVTQKLENAWRDDKPVIAVSPTTLSLPDFAEVSQRSKLSDDKRLTSPVLESSERITADPAIKLSTMARSEERPTLQLSVGFTKLKASICGSSIEKCEDFVKDETLESPQTHNEPCASRKKSPRRAVVTRSALTRPVRPARAHDKITRKRKLTVRVQEMTEEQDQESNEDVNISDIEEDFEDVSLSEIEDEWEEEEEEEDIAAGWEVV